MEKQGDNQERQGYRHTLYTICITYQKQINSRNPQISHTAAMEIASFRVKFYIKVRADKTHNWKPKFKPNAT